MKRRIFLHGKLKSLCPDGLEFQAARCRGDLGADRVTKAFTPLPGQPRHILRVAGFDTEASLYEPLPDDLTELHFLPPFSGGKGGGFFQIIIGVVLVAVAIIFGVSWCNTRRPDAEHGHIPDRRRVDLAPVTGTEEQHQS